MQTTFKYPIMVDSGLFHLPPSTTIHFHFLIIVESATSQVLLWWPK